MADVSGRIKLIKRIQIAHQNQANKPIFLMKNGEVCCGRFSYKGRYKTKFKEVFERICDLEKTGETTEEINVSAYKYWDAVRIYDEYICTEWLEGVTAEKIEQFANESEIAKLIEEIKKEFIRAVGLKWKRIFKKDGKPSKGWQIL